ncbi:MAG: YcaO-related McrA-glycine thioamidation protein [Candidatus Methanomethylophilaceae archaeon]|nr:YcaO-related McrA-glycine thioamidation protein [Candidatus Methanomethylophilaceae archaeon]
MMLQRCPKISPETGIRTKPPEETLKDVLPLLGKAGLGEPEDITSWGDTGIPVYSVDRQDTAFGKAKFYNGKGVTHEQAKASAVMESIERYCAERREEDEVVHGTYEQASDIMYTVNPVDLILPLRVLDRYNDPEIAWVKGFEMFRGCPAWVPACAVFYPYEPDGDLQLFGWHTNGIASGNTMEEAILHGLFEVIERDAWSIAEFRGYCNSDVVIDDPGSVPAKLIERFNEQGIEIHLKDLTSDTGIPTIGAVADDVRTKDPEMLVIGVGTHLDPNIAAIRAITEVAQSRATHKHGAKINAQLQKVTQEMGYEAVKKANRMWFTDHQRSVKLSEMEDASTPYVLDDIEVVLGRLMECGFDSVVAVDLTRPELGVPVVRMIVPGMEVSTMDPEREGGRLRGMWPPYRGE